MHFDQDGTYNLVYIAEDECGNKTLAERVVEVFSVRTVLYPDGTFIINEKETDIASNVALHGEATNVYTPFDPNGATDVDKYIFANSTYRPWHNERASIKSVEIGSAIAPTSTAYWFKLLEGCESIDLSNLNTSATVNMAEMFYSCRGLVSLDVTRFDTRNVTKYMFEEMSNNLVGGAGTVWSPNNPTDKTYARIDNPPDAPGYFTQKPTA